MINRVILMGRLVADPELKHSNSGLSVTSFRIAVDRNYVKQGAQRQVDFFDVVAWKNAAEFVCRHFAKGSLIAVDGRLQTRQYQTNDGHDRSSVEVVADNVSFTGERRNDAETPGNAPAPRDQAPQANYPAPPQNSVRADQGQYQPQYANGAAYDPRYQQGQFDNVRGYNPPAAPSPAGHGYTADDDLPWNRGGYDGT